MGKKKWAIPERIAELDDLASEANNLVVSGEKAEAVLSWYDSEREGRVEGYKERDKDLRQHQREVWESLNHPVVTLKRARYEYYADIAPLAVPQSPMPTKVDATNAVGHHISSRSAREEMHKRARDKLGLRRRF